MNLFNKIKLIILFISIFFLVAQTGILAQSACATELFPNQVTYVNETRTARDSIDISALGEVTIIPLVAHILADNNLTNGLSNTDLWAAINDLNEAFQPAAFHFNLCHINYIPDNDLNIIKYSRQGFSNEFTMAANTAFESALNIYFVPDARGLNNQTVCGWASYPGDLEAFNKNWIVINNTCANNGSTLAHEVGHYFNLYHTHQGVSTSLQINDIEFVDQSNCGPDIGDELCDTPAEPYRAGLGLNGTVNEDCTFLCDYKDSKGDFYDPHNGSGFNYMSYAPSKCRVYFSPDQIERMKISYLLDRNYLSGICPKASHGSSAVKDSLFLLTFYNATNGANWFPIQWNLNDPVNTWPGLQQNGQGCITKIELPGNNLNGVLPANLGNLAFLDTVILGNNNLTGNLPLSLGNLKYLKYLDLRYNAINGEIPAELSYLYGLKNLNLAHNQFTGKIPGKLGNLKNLDTLSLMHNQLSGCFNDNLNNLCTINFASIPGGWSVFCRAGANRCSCDRRMDSLALLSLYASTSGYRWHNKWNLKTSINNWNGIKLNDLGCVREIDLADNNLLGEIPFEIDALQNLEELVLTKNTVCGKIPVSIGNLNKLRVLNLSDNILSGSVPTEISNLQNLEILRLNFNKLCGYIPFEIDALQNLEEIYLAGNLFTKCYHPRLIELIDEANEVENDFYNIAINNKCTNCNINDWKVLKKFHTTNSANNIFGSTGGYFFNGINPPGGCNLTVVKNIGFNDYGRIKSIDWNNAGLSGTIPTNINLMTELSNLNLGENNLTGSIPSTLSELSNLYYLRLSNNEIDACFPSEMLDLCDQTNVFFGNDSNYLENTTLNFELFCNHVSNNCDGNATDLIYPGDFNKDGIVNHLDLLNWVKAAGNTGPGRINPTNEWKPQVCTDWAGQASGVNFKHQDANGDGYINEEDLTVMSLNYNKSSISGSANSPGTALNDSGYSLYLHPSDGLKNTFDIYIDSDDETLNSIDLQGLAFTLFLGELPVEDVYFDFPDTSFQPEVESIEEVDGIHQIAFAWNGTIQPSVNQPKTGEDPFGRLIIAIVMDEPMDDIISIIISEGSFLNDEGNYKIADISSLDYHFDNSVAIGSIECKDQKISGYFGADENLYATTYIVSPGTKYQFTTIDACSTVGFKSGGYVELKPGFYAEYGSNFLAVNRACTGSTEKNNIPYHLINHLNIYPNPVQSEGTLEFALQNQSTVNIVLTDITGKHIQQIANETNKNKGKHQLTFNVDDLPTGIYYCTLKVNDFVNTKKIIIVK